jgi:hypothetical protein
MGTGHGFPGKIGRIVKPHLLQQKEPNMANGSAAATKIIGIALVVIGIGLAFWGYRLSDDVGSRITHAFTGSYSDKVMTFYISGAACFVAGIFLAMKK